MIIRKPYAFLIKYFKIIHITLFILTTYLLFKIRTLYFFFNNYLKTGTYIYQDGMANNYLTPFMFIILILLIIAVIFIFSLMKNKKKPTLFYMVFLINCFLTLILFIYFYSEFNSLEIESFSNQKIVIYRDIWMVLYYLQYYFIIITFIRGFGFNIKKFNFEKDIKELDITDKDREEIELTTNIDYENILTIIRKKIRLFKYYIKENSFVLLVFLGIILLSLGIYFSLDKFVINKTYSENDLVSVNNFTYQVNNSYYTNLDISGNIISEKYDYFIIDTTVTNKSNKALQLDTLNTRINIRGKYYYPKTINISELNDLGIMYTNQYLGAKQTKNYLFIFQIDSNLLNSFFKKQVYFQIYNFTNNKGSEAIINYKQVKLDYFNIDDKDLGIYSLNDKVKLDNTFYNKGSLLISNLDVLDDYEYEYSKCDLDDSMGMCNDFTASIIPSLNKVLLKLEYSGEFEKDIFDKYLTIKYYIDGKEYEIENNKVKDITPDNYSKNNVFLDVSNDIKNADKIILEFNIRQVIFKYEIGDIHE